MVVSPSHGKESAVERFLKKHAQNITGTISCFDRILFKGHLPISWGGAMERFMGMQGLLIKDFKRFVTQQSERVKAHAKLMAQKAKRPYIHLNRLIRKEDMARQIAARDGVASGLVCVIAAVEACQSFRLLYGEGRPRIVNAPRKCLCLYFYFVDRQFGLMHVRIQTWFPFTVQVCLNGHEWLARKMDKHGIAYQKLDNAFVRIQDSRRAQRFADGFVRKNWPRILRVLARRVNPLLDGLLKGFGYYWVVEQAEFATDVIFKDRPALKPLYKELVKHAVVCFTAEDVLTFLGKKLHGNFTGEVHTHYKKRYPGARVKHRIAQNGIKMYDKHGIVLRIETVINRPYAFKVRRWGKRKGKHVMGWFPMAKGVANLYRYAEVCIASNRRYLGALASVADPSQAQASLRNLAKPLRKNGRTHRGFNPASDDDTRLFAVIMRGEHAIMGFRNSDIRHHLFTTAKTQRHKRRQSAHVSRLLKRLHVRRLIAKIPRSRRWRLTPDGEAIMSMALTLHSEKYPQLLITQAA
jgi:hypothetical protein